MSFTYFKCQAGGVAGPGAVNGILESGRSGKDASLVEMKADSAEA
jgi:hypothetical protein